MLASFFKKNEHVHSFQNAREHARMLFYFQHSFSQSQQFILNIVESNTTVLYAKCLAEIESAVYI